jgi:hypothetical protein
MGEKELREKYGGKLAKAINRAIRAEVPGRERSTGRLTQLAGAARHSHWTDRNGKEDAGGNRLLPAQARRGGPHGRAGPAAMGVPPDKART